MIPMLWSSVALASRCDRVVVAHPDTSCVALGTGVRCEEFLGGLTLRPKGVLFRKLRLQALEERLSDQWHAWRDVEVGPSQEVLWPPAETDETLWGLARIQQKDAVKGPVAPPAIRFDPSTPVTVYLIDSLITRHGTSKRPHDSLAENVIEYHAVGADCTSDCLAHGTNMAAVIAGRHFGVATGASLVSVGILDGGNEACTSDVLGALNWVEQDVRTSCNEAWVVNLSFEEHQPLSSAAMEDMTAAGARLMRHGAVVVVAVGNTPLEGGISEIGSIAVGELNRNTDRKESFICRSEADIYAPGRIIGTADNADPTSTTVVGGTSVATAFTSGAIVVELAQSLLAEPHLSAQQRAGVVVERVVARRSIPSESTACPGAGTLCLAGAPCDSAP